MCGPQNDVDNVWVLPANLRECLDRMLDSLGWAKQAEGEDDVLAFDLELVLEKTRIHKRRVVDAVRNQIDLLPRDLVAAVQNVGRTTAHHNRPVGELQEFGQYLAEFGFRRLLEDRVQRRDDGHAKLAQQREQMTPGLTAEDAELVLDADEVDMTQLEETRGPPVR